VGAPPRPGQFPPVRSRQHPGTRSAGLSSTGGLDRRRMINFDDRTLVVANPEDADDYLGFDLTLPNRASRRSVSDCANGHAIA